MRYVTLDDKLAAVLLWLDAMKMVLPTFFVIVREKAWTTGFRAPVSR